MRFFFVSDTIRTKYFGTLDLAHRGAKEPINLTDGTGFRRDWVKIEEIEVATDKAGVLALLNGFGGTETTLRVWTLTDRGGLLEEQE